MLKGAVPASNAAPRPALKPRRVTRADVDCELYFIGFLPGRETALCAMMQDFSRFSQAYQCAQRGPLCHFRGARYRPPAMPADIVDLDNKFRQHLFIPLGRSKKRRTWRWRQINGQPEKDGGRLCGRKRPRAGAARR